MKINYELEMQNELNKIGEGSEKKLLIHSCCAPCSCAILEYLKKYVEISIYFFNPNITEKEEYITRLNEQFEFDKEMNFNMNIIEGEYNPKDDFIKNIKGLENESEGGARCKVCYKLRMEATAKKAKELGYDYFSTVLSISPLKNAGWINEIGIELEEKYGVKFLRGDFKKKSRYLRSVNLSKEHNLYRQDYCGCIYSKLEREKQKKEKDESGKKHIKTNNRRFYSLNDFFKNEFGEKVYKVSLDGGFTCPNRDGKISKGGCIFCSDSGSGEFAGNRIKSITDQINEQLDFLGSKIGDAKVIAYFQNFTNTYGDVKYLEKIYTEALSHDRVIGLAIGTRPDCLEDDILDLLDRLNKKHFLWVELGLQTSNNEVSNLINRGYDYSIYEENTRRLFEKNIKFVTHMIIGLPNETDESIMKTAKDIVNSKAWGIKIHSLHIIKETKLAKIYETKPFRVHSLEEYVTLVCDIIKLLPPKMVVHRVTGDGKKDEVIEPIWSLNKRKVLNEIEMQLKNRGHVHIF